MTSLNLDVELWCAEEQQELGGDAVGPMCCWWFDCWGP